MLAGMINNFHTKTVVSKNFEFKKTFIFMRQLNRTNMLFILWEHLNNITCMLIFVGEQ